MAALGNNIKQLGNQRIPQSIILGDLTQTILLATTHLQKGFIAENRESLDKAVEGMLGTRKAITDNFDKLKVSLATEKGKELYQAMVDARKPNAAMRDKIVKALKDGNKQEAVAFLGEYEPLQAAYLKSVNNMEDYVRELSKKSSEGSINNVQITRVLIIVLGLLAVGVAILVAFSIIRSITGPLNEAVDTANSIAGGDLTVSIENTGSNETGQLLAAMKTMVAKLKGVIGEMKRASESVASGSEQLSANSGQITRTMNEQSNRSSQIAPFYSCRHSK